MGRKRLTDDIVAESGRGDEATGGFDGFDYSVDVEVGIQETLVVCSKGSEHEGEVLWTLLGDTYRVNHREIEGVCRVQSHATACASRNVSRRG